MIRNLIILVLTLATTTLTAAEQPANRPLFRDFLGINGHFTFKPELYRPVARLARNYHNINWDVKKPGDAITLPVCVNRVHWINNVYGRWLNAGFETDICLMFNGFDAGGTDYRKLWAGREQWCFDYGKAVANTFGPSAGKGLCTSIEIGNEPGQKFDAAVYKTIFSRMAAGIRAGDPKVKIVTAAAWARPADDYIQDLRAIYGDAKLLPLYDVINLHTYAMVDRREKPASPWDRSYPEDPAISYLAVVDEAIAWRDRFAPGKEIWITEFGYDACTADAMTRRSGWFAKLDWRGNTELQQAQYLVRSCLAFAQRDVKRAYVYFYDDNDSPSVHGSSGLTRKFVPKPAYYAIRQLLQTLGDYRFNRVVTHRPNELCTIEFVHATEAGNIIWIAWSPTGARTHDRADRTARTAVVTLTNLPASPRQVFAMATADTPAAPVEWRQGGLGSISLTITESPTYIVMRRTASR